jgi:hypothetical protein
MGKTFDATGSYHLALTILIPATILSAGLMLPLGGRPVPAKASAVEA